MKWLLYFVICSDFASCRISFSGYHSFLLLIFSFDKSRVISWQAKRLLYFPDTAFYMTLVSADSENVTGLDLFCLVSVSSRSLLHSKKAQETNTSILQRKR
jgi:hypothetical protein